MANDRIVKGTFFIKTAKEWNQLPANSEYLNPPDVTQPAAVPRWFTGILTRNVQWQTINKFLEPRCISEFETRSYSGEYSGEYFYSPSLLARTFHQKKRLHSPSSKKVSMSLQRKMLAGLATSAHDFLNLRVLWYTCIQQEERMPSSRLYAFFLSFTQYFFFHCQRLASNTNT